MYNELAINTSYSSLELHNNIFYLGRINNKAVVLSGGELNSDHNLFYPDLSGFVSINDQAVQDISELQQIYKKDNNSINSDPLFRNISTHDFSILQESPAPLMPEYIWVSVLIFWVIWYLPVKPPIWAL